MSPVRSSDSERWTIFTTVIDVKPVDSDRLKEQKSLKKVISHPVFLSLRQKIRLNYSSAVLVSDK